MLQTTGDDESDHGRHVALAWVWLIFKFLPEVREFFALTYRYPPPTHKQGRT